MIFFCIINIFIIKLFGSISINTIISACLKLLNHYGIIYKPKDIGIIHFTI